MPSSDREADRRLQHPVISGPFLSKSLGRHQVDIGATCISAQEGIGCGVHNILLGRIPAEQNALVSDDLLRLAVPVRRHIPLTVVLPTKLRDDRWWLLGQCVDEAVKGINVL